MKLAKQLVAALAITALAVPVTAVGVFALSAAPALAKSPNGQGNGKANGNGQGKANKPDKKPKTSNRGGNGKSNGNGYGKAKNGKATAAAYVASTDDADVVASQRPSQLGSMNGAMHANINAVLAHIRNGNTHGPVGALAGLAVADHNAEGARETLDQLTAARGDLETDLEDAVANNTDYATLQDYLDAKDLAAADGDAFEEDTAIEDAIAALDAADKEIAGAQDALDAQTAAEDGIFDAWNKYDQATDAERDALLDALRARLDANGEAISNTIGMGDILGNNDAPDADGSIIGEPADEEIVADAPSDENPSVE